MVGKGIKVGSLALLFFCTFIYWAHASEKKKLDLLPIYVGHGSTTLLKDSCFTAIYDIGGEPKYFETVIRELTTAKSKIRSRHIDVLIISHEHKDHISYLKGLIKKKFTINTLISNNSTLAKISLIPGFNDSVKHTKGFSATLDTNTVNIRGKDISDCNIDIDFEIFWGSTIKAQGLSEKYNKKKKNNDSLVIGVSGDSLNKSIIFLGDSNSIAQNKIMKHKSLALKKYTNSILFAGHHGYSNGVDYNFLNYITPSAVVISRSANKPMLKKDLDIINFVLKTPENKFKMPLYNALCSPLPRQLRYKKHHKVSKICPAKLSHNIFTLSPNIQLNLSSQ